jgi:hypothetical protein
MSALGAKIILLIKNDSKKPIGHFKFNKYKNYFLDMEIKIVEMFYALLGHLVIK